MRHSTSDKQFSKIFTSFNSIKPEPVARRNFLHGMVIAGVSTIGIASSIKHAFAHSLVEAEARNITSTIHPVIAHQFDDTEAWREVLSIYPMLVQQFDDPDAWREQVQNLTSKLDSSLAKEINPQIRNANLVKKTDPTDTHTAFKSPWVFDSWKLSERKVVCHNGYAIEQFPLYAANCTCEKYRDLNSPEIGSFISAYEYNRFNCVLAPAGQREAFGEYSDHAKQDFSNTVANRYRRDPTDYRVHYHRPATNHDGSKTRRVFLATHKPSGNPEVFIGDEDI